MAIELDIQSWQQGTGGSRECGALVRPDWRGLQARLLAAREARRTFVAGGSTGGSGSSGSFDGPVARWISALGHHSAFVNPNDSANRNADGANEAIVAAEDRSGDRG
jgi:hypothetical protein